MNNNKRNQLKMSKLRHSSLDLAEVEMKKKQHQDVLTRARNKFLMLSDALKNRKADENQNNRPLPKSMTQCTLDYLFKHSQEKDKNHHGFDADGSENAPLQRQTSVGSYPIEIRVSSYENDLDEDPEGIFIPISRLRPATVCVDSPSVNRRSDADALALERPRKKLSFKEPEAVTLKKTPKKSTINHKPDETIHRKISQHVTTNQKPESNTQVKKPVANHKQEESQASKTKNGHGFNKWGLKTMISGGGKKNSEGEGEFTLGKGIKSMAGLGLSVVSNGVNRTPSFEDRDLESQALRVVRTVGQAFEVCHKLSIGAPEDNLDDEQETTVTQDLLSDRLSDVASDKPKKDLDTNSDRNSLNLDEASLKDSYLDTSVKTNKTNSPRLGVLPPPPVNNQPSSRKNLPLQAETYAAPHSDGLGNNSNAGSTGTTMPPPGSALSSHHELQLLREQLDQQKQQTQAAMAQLQLAREQLQAEQTARMEAQARTHQLLVHNRELLDHIAALVAHLQGGEKTGQQSSQPQMTMPQLSSAAKVERWFELLEPLSISRPESGFVSCQDNDPCDYDDEKEILEGTRNLLSKLSARKQRKLLGLKLGKVTTF